MGSKTKSKTTTTTVDTTRKAIDAGGTDGAPTVNPKSTVEAGAGDTVLVNGAAEDDAAAKAKREASKLVTAVAAAVLILAAVTEDAAAGLCDAFGIIGEATSEIATAMATVSNAAALLRKSDHEDAGYYADALAIAVECYRGRHCAADVLGANLAAATNDAGFAGELKTAKDAAVQLRNAADAMVYMITGEKTPRESRGTKSATAGKTIYAKALMMRFRAILANG